MLNPIKYLILIAAMCAVVATSNYLVQFPVNYSFAKINLADILTWAAFTYPVAFLITDLSNRFYGPSGARKIRVGRFRASSCIINLASHPTNCYCLRPLHFFWLNCSTSAFSIN